ncbi:MAG: LysM peptidoglycan-binding domain-containing protein [Cyclobacteriaceae bacterium]|nr:LysM peptidoglycan-binding domain-containing protein [Cyclobacteriaceae bacterium]MCH8517689.1 LysM peptidoglycan-binding domain-containing protein [Cyclobacteriaceae bacterium]
MRSKLIPLLAIGLILLSLPSQAQLYSSKINANLRENPLLPFQKIEDLSQIRKPKDREAKNLYDRHTRFDFVGYDGVYEQLITLLTDYPHELQATVRLVESVKKNDDLKVENLAYLSFAAYKSGANPFYNERNFAGFWGLNHAQAAQYGLKVSSEYDERREWEKSFSAFQQVANENQKNFQNPILFWLALMESPAFVNRFYKDKKEFDQLAKPIQDNFRGLAALDLIIHQAEFFGFDTQSISLTLERETLKIEETIHLSDIEKSTGIPQKELMVWNPAILDSIARPRNAFYIKPDKRATFNQIGDAVYAAKDKKKVKPTYLDKKEEPKKASTTTVKQAEKVEPEARQQIYVVKSGDVLGKIAGRYQVSIADLKAWNKLTSDRIDIGQRLKIYSDASPSEEAEAVAHSTQEKNTDEYIIHELKAGETLWSLARQHEGVSVDDLVQWNDIKDISDLKIGQKLKIKKAN